MQIKIIPTSKKQLKEKCYFHAERPITIHLPRDYDKDSVACALTISPYTKLRICAVIHTHTHTHTHTYIAVIYTRRDRSRAIKNGRSLFLPLFTDLRLFGHYARAILHVIPNARAREREREKNDRGRAAVGMQHCTMEKILMHASIYNLPASLSLPTPLCCVYMYMHTYI